MTKKERAEANSLIHKSHRMTRWGSSIVSVAVTPRFGLLRECKNCEAEQCFTVSGLETHEELKRKCVS